MLKPLLERRLTNLDQHAKRMKSKYYSDWDDIWDEGEHQYKPDNSKLENSFSVDDSIKSQDDNEDDSEEDEELEEKSQIDETIHNRTSSIETNNTDSDKVSNDVDTQLKPLKQENAKDDRNIKQSTASKGEPVKQTIPLKSNNLVNHKFLKQIASAEENVKKLLGSPPKKQSNRPKSTASNVKQ